jgi:hypothetical protein
VIASARVAGSTTIVAVSDDDPPALAVTYVTPADTPVINPATETLATDEFCERHWIVRSRSLRALTTRAVSCVAVPTGIVSIFDEMETRRDSGEARVSGLVDSPRSHPVPAITVTTTKDAVTMRCIVRMSPSPRVRSAARPAWHALFIACGSPVCFASPTFAGFAFVAFPAWGRRSCHQLWDVSERRAMNYVVTGAVFTIVSRPDASGDHTVQ